jgi:hypothetical protein
MNSFISQALPIGIALISILAFIVSLITEVIKNLGFLKRIPTNILVLVLSIIVTIIAYFAYCSYNNCQVYWYTIVGSFFSAFIVAYVATYGWEKLHTLYLRFQKRKNEK